MVPVERDNAFQLRDHLHSIAVAGSRGDAFKTALMLFLGLGKADLAPTEPRGLSLYQKCSISGLAKTSEVSTSELSRLLGHAPKIDSTPMAWVSDVFGVLAITWLVERMHDDQLSQKLSSWTAGFVPDQTRSSRLSNFEKDIARYVAERDTASFMTACVPLLLHYLGRRKIVDHQIRSTLHQRFMRELRQQARDESSAVLLGLMVYVFDKINDEIELVPPNGWSLYDLVKFLEHIPVGLKRWTWEEKSRTGKGEPVKWPVRNEYHVQNLLYVFLGPIFNDIADEIYLNPVGQKTPRVDLYLPSIHTLIEVKYRRDSKKSFQELIGEVAEDASLYRTDSRYTDARLVTFLWDHSRATQEHAKFKEGVMRIPGMNACVVISSPSTMTDNAVE